MNFKTDIFVKDRYTGRIHRVGDDPHDSLYVDEKGNVHYYNLQNGEGCGKNSKKVKTLAEKYPDMDWGERANEFTHGFEFVTCRKECEYCTEECPFGFNRIDS